MRPTIGVVLRVDKNITNKNIQLIYNNIFSALSINGANVVGIYNNDQSMELLKICDGFVLQGGNVSTDFDYKLVKYCHKFDIPLLGICLGMQTIGEVFGGILSNTKTIIHNSNDELKLHKVVIYKNTKLFDILGEYNIDVNSRHNFEIKGPNLIVSGRSNDGVIEAIEDSTKKFFIGIQWHPEDMIDYDKFSCKIFKEFIKQCKKKG